MEMALNVLAYNMKRMIALIGSRGLMAPMPGNPSGVILIENNGFVRTNASPKPRKASETAHATNPRRNLQSS